MLVPHLWGAVSTRMHARTLTHTQAHTHTCTQSNLHGRDCSHRHRQIKRQTDRHTRAREHLPTATPPHNLSLSHIHTHTCTADHQDWNHPVFSTQRVIDHVHENCVPSKNTATQTSCKSRAGNPTSEQSRARSYLFLTGKELPLVISKYWLSLHSGRLWIVRLSVA